MKQHLWILAMLLCVSIAPVRAQITVLSESFENGIPATWTIIDADGDSHNWSAPSYYDDPLYGAAHTGTGYAFSFSYYEYETLAPDNWLVTPPIELSGTSTLYFYRTVYPTLPDDHYGVYISTTSPTDLSSFTLLYEETPFVETSDWMMRSVDLSVYSDSTVYIAFRHFNSTDQYFIALDDITVTTTTANPVITVAPAQLWFDNAVMGAATQAQQLTVDAFNLSDSIVATTAVPFEISTDNINYSATATLPNTGGELFVRYFPTNSGADTGAVTFVSGTTTQIAVLEGSSIDCSYITLPYAENFDSVTPSTLPNCWQRVNPYENNGMVFPAASMMNPHGGEGNSLEFENDNTAGVPTYVVLPRMPQNLNNLQISFWSRRENVASGTLSVGYMTEPSNANTFVPVWNTSGSSAASDYEPIVVSFENVQVNPSQDYFIAFKYQSNVYWYWYVDDVVVEELPSCPKPNHLTVSHVTNHAATLSWNGNANNYVLYYKTSTASDWDSIANVALNDGVYVLNNLVASTSYQWYVAAVCPDGTLSSSLDVSSFTTDCDPYIAPFVENFNDDSALPACWKVLKGLASEVFAGAATTEVNGYWGFLRQNVFGMYHPVLNVYGSTCKYWLVTPAIDLSALTNPSLTFDLALTNYNSTTPANPHNQSDDKFMVIISTDNGATWSAANATVWSNDGLGDYVFNQISAVGQEVTISLANYANQTIKIAFYAESTESGNGDNDIHVDNVSVMEATSCAKPMQLAVTDEDMNSVTLSWAEMGNATSWNIQYGPAGFNPGDSNATVVLATTNPFTVSGLTATVSYGFYVQANCGDELSPWVGPVTAMPGSYNMATSGTDTVISCGMMVYDNGGMNSDYANYCNGTLIIYPETEGSLVSVSGYYDVEEDYDFLRIYDGVGTNGVLLGEFTGIGYVHDLVATNGPLTIRFTSDNAMQSSGFELLVSCVSCAPPVNVTVSELNSTSAELTWSDNGAASWMVEYKGETDTAWETQVVTDTVVMLTGLDMVTLYEVHVSTNCEGEYSSPAIITFHTTMDAANLPYSTDFSANADQNWMLNNGGCTNRWTIGTLSNNASALFVTNDDINAGYNTESYSVVSAEKLFTVGQANEFVVSFDVQVGGEGNFDYLKVFFAPADAQYPAGTGVLPYATDSYSEFAVNFSDYLQYSENTAFPYKFNMTSGNTVHVVVTMPNPNVNPTDNSLAKLVFLWKNDQSSGLQPGAIVYNASVSAVTCPAPTYLTVSNLTPTSANVVWNSNASSWNLEIKEVTDSIWTSVAVTGTPSYQFTNLTPGAAYDMRVQAICGGEDVSIWEVGSFIAPCHAITTFPYTEGFEHDGNMPDCWTQEHVSGTINWTFMAGNYGTSSIDTAHSGSYNAFFFYDDDAVHFISKLISPAFDLTNVQDPYITYWFSQAAWVEDQDFLTVSYRTSPTDAWHPLQQYNTSISEWTMDSLSLPNPSATYQIAFEGYTSYGYGITLDDITIAGAIALTEPMATTAAATNVEQTSATLNGSISNPDNVTIIAQGFEWKTSVGGTYVAVNVPGETMTYNLTGLTASTEYTYRAFVTTAHGTHYGDEETFTTNEEVILPCEVPTGVATSNITHESITVSWDDNDNVDSWTLLYRPVNGQNSVETTTTNQMVLTGLAPETTYEIQLRANCGGDNVSDWTATETATTLVGINTYLENNVTLYPNPANEYVDVRVDGDVNVTGMDMFDVYGKLIRTVVGVNNDSPIRINVSDLSAGMYFVRVTTEQGVVTKRFVKK